MKKITTMKELLNERLLEEDIIKFVYNYDNKFSELEKENKEKSKEIERLKELCNKYEEEHKTVFEEWKKTINIINELEKMMKNDLECACSMNENGLFNGAIDILEVYLDKLQKLKGSDKE